VKLKVPGTQGSRNIKFQRKSFDQIAITRMRSVFWQIHRLNAFDVRFYFLFDESTRLFKCSFHRVGFKCLRQTMAPTARKGSEQKTGHPDIKWSVVAKGRSIRFPDIPRFFQDITRRHRWAIEGRKGSIELVSHYNQTKEEKKILLIVGERRIKAMAGGYVNGVRGV